MINVDSVDFSFFYHIFPELFNKETDTSMWVYMRFLPKKYRCL